MFERTSSQSKMMSRRLLQSLTSLMEGMFKSTDHLITNKFSLALMLFWNDLCRYTVPVTLFDDFGVQFAEELEDCKQTEIYIIIAAAKVGLYEGKIFYSHLLLALQNLTVREILNRYS